MHASFRRSLLLAGITLACGRLAAANDKRATPGPQDKPLAALYAKLIDLEFRMAGRLGVAAIDTANGQAIRYRAGQRFPFCSTFKLMLVAAILKESMSRPQFMKEHIAYSERDLLSYAPVTRQNLHQGMRVFDLCAATLQYSDNTAANLLIGLLGGVAAVTGFARVLGDKAFRLDRWEPELNAALPGDPRDTTTPWAMAGSVQKIVLGDALGAAQRTQMVEWLRGNTTGDASIRAGVPADWRVGDKTGSGAYGTSNDVAVLWPPAAPPVVLTIFFTTPRQDAEPRRDVLAAATRMVIDHLVRDRA